MVTLNRGSVLIPPQNLPGGERIAVLRDQMGVTCGVVVPAKSRCRRFVIRHGWRLILRCYIMPRSATEEEWTHGIESWRTGTGF
jgi:hypothetical protein